MGMGYTKKNTFGSAVNVRVIRWSGWRTIIFIFEV